MNPRHTLTGQLAGGFIESKLTLVLMIAALIFGIWAVLSTPREENPQISICFLYLFMQFFKNFPEYRIDTKQ